jgi:hypothetical protein
MKIPFQDNLDELLEGRRRVEKRHAYRIFLRVTVASRAVYGLRQPEETTL